MKQFQYVLAAVLLLFATGGCRNWPIFRQPHPAAPEFVVPPNQQQLIDKINANTSRVRQLQSSVKVGMQGMPDLSGDLAVEAPRRFRLKAGLFGLNSTGVDLGSNDERFWVWMKQSLDPQQPAGVYYARHDQYAQSSMRQLLPIEPDWIVQALGLVTFDATAEHEGPIARGKNQLEIRSKLASANGEVTRITVVDSRYGWMLEQHLYDAAGQWLASSRGFDHRYYAEQDVSLPQTVTVQVPAPPEAIAAGAASSLSITLRMGAYEINSLQGSPTQLWAMPRPQGFPMIDLANPNAHPSTPVSAPADPNVPRGEYTPIDDPRLGFRPTYRGMQR